MSAREDVYNALTADLGAGGRSMTEAWNVLDFNGLLHVDAVDGFVDAIRAWQRQVLAHNVRGATIREVRERLTAAAGGAR